MVLMSIRFHYIIFNILLFSFVYLNDFKNVTVLDIESRTQMKKYMKSISKDLGVKCSHCHNMDDKSIDTPAKDITREMIKLTRYLNTFLNKQMTDSTDKRTFVTCWTCHHGQLIPENTRPEED